jgi:hypothetical protein
LILSLFPSPVQRSFVECFLVADEWKPLLATGAVKVSCSMSQTRKQCTILLDLQYLVLVIAVEGLFALTQ